MGYTRAIAWVFDKRSTQDDVTWPAQVARTHAVSGFTKVLQTEERAVDRVGN